MIGNLYSGIEYPFDAIKISLMDPVNQMQFLGGSSVENFDFTLQDEHISLPPELKHLADDLSGSKNRPKDIYKLLPQIFQGLDKDDFIALLELLNVDGSVNTRKAVDIMLSLGAPQSAIEQFKKLVYKLNGQLEADLILYAFDITDRSVPYLKRSSLTMT